VLSDGVGTTRATVNGVQAITSTLTTEAFGNVVAQWGSSANPYRFAGAWGYRDDGDAGLLHVGARYYDPQVGRFVSRDAVLSEHPYLYCEHEPVNAVDPQGFFKVRVKPYIKWKGIKVSVDEDSLDIKITLPWRPVPGGPEIGVEIGIEIPLPPPSSGYPVRPGDVYGGPPPGSKITLPGTSPPREVYI
jgi:RHS repeat-associated protein